MSGDHGERHETMLGEILFGPGDPYEALRASEVAGCEQCRAELEALLATRARLESAGRGARETVAAASAIRGAPGEERSTAALRQRLTESAARAPRSTPRARVWIALAAAAAIAVVLWRWSGTSSDPRDSHMLGPEALVAVEPVGRVAEWKAFRWTGKLPERGWFLVLLRGTSDDGQAWRQESPHLREPQWSPATTAGWPRAIEWEVHSFTASGEPFDSCSAQASLSD
jgi:hypothetical protein